MPRIVATAHSASVTTDKPIQMGCDLAQGFHVSRPLPAAAMSRLLAERRGVRSSDTPHLRVVRA